MRSAMSKGSKIIVIMLIALLMTSGCGNNSADTHKLIQVSENVFTFPDGEHVSIWKYPNDRKLLYLLDDGTELLAISDIEGPDNHSVEGVESVNALDQTAQDNIIAFYAQQGAPYTAWRSI